MARLTHLLSPLSGTGDCPAEFLDRVIKCIHHPLAAKNLNSADYGRYIGGITEYVVRNHRERLNPRIKANKPLFLPELGEGAAAVSQHNSRLH